MNIYLGSVISLLLMPLFAFVFWILLEELGKTYDAIQEKEE